LRYKNEGLQLPEALRTKALSLQLALDSLNVGIKLQIEYAFVQVSVSRDIAQAHGG
jgi:hypothetical protein